MNLPVKVSVIGTACQSIGRDVGIGFGGLLSLSDRLDTLEWRSDMVTSSGLSKANGGSRKDLLEPKKTI